VPRGSDCRQKKKILMIEDCLFLSDDKFRSLISLKMLVLKKACLEFGFVFGFDQLPCINLESMRILMSGTEVTCSVLLTWYSDKLKQKSYKVEM